ncbi:MAG: calcineurin-like phosphoesterase family protein [Prolixibacteraceae bacterium]|nr:calcineurin-like phosphoesterase family protein [Prolixibacteraceae bacterium]
MKNYLLILAMVVLPAVLTAQGMVRGVVYGDLNGNGKMERREKGLPGVAVSNGREVVLTGPKGEYTLPVGIDNIIFVIKPEQYAMPLSEFNLPRFYHIHKPGGSPQGYKYPGVAPTGPLPRTVDFGLLPSEEKESFTALVLGDPQPLTREEVDFFNRGIIDEIAGIGGVAFGISLGDLVWDDLDLHLPYLEAVKRVGLPWYNVMGNHDQNYEARTDSLADETFEARFGPANYAFNYGKAHFILLDDILYPDPQGKSRYRGGLRPDQLEFIANDLRHVNKDKLVVLSFHIPLHSTDAEEFGLACRQQLFDILKEFPNLLVMSAHTHLQRHNFYGPGDGWQGSKPLHEFNSGTSCGDWHKGELDERGIPLATMYDGTPKGYSFLRIDGNRYVIDYKAAGKPDGYQMHIVHPRVVPLNQRTGAQITVNFFMGHMGNQVEYRIDEGKWSAMNHTEKEDPAYLEQLWRWDSSEELLPGRRPSSPQRCAHLWQAAMPAVPTEGLHTIEVRATDMFGRTFLQESSFKVSSPKK